jgi:hypothetical protein
LVITIGASGYDNLARSSSDIIFSSQPGFSIGY